MARLGGSDFEADMALFAAKVGRRLNDLPAEAARLTIADARVPVSSGGNMPVRHGNLRNSVEASLSGGSLANQEYPDEPHVSDPTSRIEAVLSRARIGSIISISFRAIYGPKQELKHAFTRLAAQKWSPVHVAQAVRNVIARHQ